METKLIPKGLLGLLSKLKETIRDGLNTAGEYYDKFSKAINTAYTTTALDEMGHPIMQANGLMALRISTPKKDITAAVTGISLPVSMVTVGVPATVGGITVGLATGHAGNKAGRKVAKAVGANKKAQEMAGDVGSFLGSIPGGVAGAKAGQSTYNMGIYSYNRGTWYSPFEYIIAHSNPGKRAIEIAMRTTPAANPIPGILDRMANPIRRKGALRYIATGNKKGLHDYTHALHKITSTDVVDLGNDSYNGSSSNFMLSGEGDADMVGAYLYGKALPFKRIDDYGVHANYLRKNYSNKKVPVYEIEGEQPNVVSNGKVTEGNGVFYFTGRDGSTLILNAAGHLVEHGTAADGTPMIRRLDIWKFNPKDWKKKWVVWMDNNLGPNWSKNPKLIDFGLHTVEEAGTPVIVRTPWMPNPLGGYSELVK